MAKFKTGRQAREERERMLILKHKYENRITIAKFGKESLDAGDYSNALSKFVEYLQIMAEIKQTQDYYHLRTGHFNTKKELTEMLMISHIYFEMARIYDAVPKFASESQKCLDQFVLFSANQPYQVVNSEMVRKYLKKAVFKNPDAFRHAHAQIFVQSKKCYVVTFCYGTEHPITQEYRALKDRLLESDRGRELVRLYYKYSSEAVPRWEHSRGMAIAARLVFRPLLVFVAKAVLPFILK
jgi:hypothetical protein